MQKKEPPQRIQEEFEQIRKEDVKEIAVREEIFAPSLLSVKSGAAERYNHVMCVLRYWLAHRQATGLTAFRGIRNKRIICYEWAGGETDTAPRQIENEIRNIYEDNNDPHGAFEEHLKEFKQVFEEYEALC
jgi:hypothetical protein